MRYIYNGNLKDGNGRVLSDATVNVYLAGGTTPANIYTASSGGVAVNSVTTDSDGDFYFYVDEADYNPDQRFKVVTSKVNYISNTYDDIVIFPFKENTYYANAGVADQGVDSDDNSIADLMVEIGEADERTIVLRPEIYRYSTDDTITSNITLDVRPGALISVDSGVTLTTNGCFKAGRYQVFTGDGSVVFGSGAVTEVYPEWFGVVADGTTDDTSSFQACVDSVPDGGVIRLPHGTLIVSNITGISNMRIIGEKNASIIKHKANSSDHMLECSGDVDFVSVQIDGNKDNQTGRYAGIYFNGDNFSISDSIIKNTVSEGVFVYNADLVDISNNSFMDIAEHGDELNENAYAVRVQSETTESTIKVCGNTFKNSAPSGNDRAPCAIGINLVSNMCKFCLVDGNTVDGFGQSFSGNPLGAIDVYKNADRITVTNNRVKNFYYTAIRTLDCTQSIIKSNQIDTPAYDFGEAAISNTTYVHEATAKYDCIIANNQISNQYGDGIYYAGGGAGKETKRAVIDGNNIIDCERGIYIRYVNGQVSLVGNNINSASSYGILVEDAAGCIEVIGGSLVGGSDVPIFARSNVTGLNFIVNGVHIDADTLSYGISCRNLESLNIQGCEITGTPTGNVIDYSTISRLVITGNIFEKPYLSGSTTWDPASIADGSKVSQGVTVPGAALGDFVDVSFSLDVSDLVLNAQVTAVDTVTAVLANNTGGAVDLGEGTLKVVVSKRY